MHDGNTCQVRRPLPRVNAGIAFGAAIWNRASALAVGIFAAVIAAAYVALTLAQVGMFRLWACLLAAAGVGALAAVIVFRRHAPPGGFGRIGWVAALAIALGSMAMTMPPSEAILGGWDPGVYVHTAAAIARQGSLQIRADDIARLPGELKPGLTREIAGWRHPFLGMFPLPNGRLSPQFMHLYPALMAVGYALAGVWGALLVNPVLNVFAILAMYAFASKILGPKWALAAALLLALNPAQVWQAKFSTAEILSQLLLLTGFGVFIDFMRRDDAILAAAVSGALLGLAFFTRYDAILVLVPLLLILIGLRHQPEDRRSLCAFLLAMAFFGLHAWAHMKFVAPCYRPLPGLVFPLLLLALFCGVALLILAQCPCGRAWIAWLTRNAKWLRVGFTLGLVGLVAFVWYVRPRLAIEGRVWHLCMTFLDAIGLPRLVNSLAGAQAFNIEYLTAIFGVAGLLLAFAGVGVLIWRVPDQGAAAWLVVATATMALLLINVFHDHFMMWVSRRFVPVVIPLLVIGMAAAAKEIHKQVHRYRRSLAVPLSVGVLALVTVMSLPKTVAMASIRDWPGLHAWLSELTSLIPADAVVFCDQPGFAAPLRFVYGVEAHEVYGGLTGSQVVYDHRANLGASSKRMHILSMRDQPAFPEIELRAQGRMTLMSHILVQPSRTIPMRTQRRAGRFVLYEVHFD